MRGKTYPDRVEIFVKPEDIIFAPAFTKKDDKLESIPGICLGSFVNWYAWWWITQNHPQILKGRDISSMNLEWNGETFSAIFREDPLPE